jgi:hypothetical protein
MLCFTSCTPKPSASSFTHHFPMMEDIITVTKGPLLIIMISSEANWEMGVQSMQDARQTLNSQSCSTSLSLQCNHSRWSKCPREQVPKPHSALLSNTSRRDKLGGRNHTEQFTTLNNLSMTCHSLYCSLQSPKIIHQTNKLQAGPEPMRLSRNHNEQLAVIRTVILVI